MSKKGGLADPSRLSPVDKKDEDLIRAVIETPSGSRNKYSYDEEEKIFIFKRSYQRA
jgi:inorganic pyrophosphatase